jgi:copper(I)-binding protein
MQLRPATRPFFRYLCSAPSWSRPFAIAATTLGLGLALSNSGYSAALLTVENPWFRYITSQVPAAGYMTLRNPSGQDAVLIGAESPACGMLMMHKTSKSGSMDTMAHVRSITVPAHGTFAFAPGSYHFMCVQPQMKAGQTVTVTLIFQGGQQVIASFAVRGPGSEGGSE